MYTEQFVKSPCFDSTEPNYKFEFVKPGLNHLDLNTPLVISSSFKCKNLTVKEDERIREGTLALHGVLLAHFDAESSKHPIAVLDISFARIKVLPQTKGSLECGFMLGKNGNCLGFYFEDKLTMECWLDALKKICVKMNFHEEYKAIKLIGKGGFAKVHLVESKLHGQSYAVKQFKKESVISMSRTHIKSPHLNEIEMMRVLDHENLIKLYEIFESDNSIYLIIELVEGKPLEKVLKKYNGQTPMPENKVKHMIHSILNALSYLASRGIMHRDLKPDNILVDKTGKIKIVDFGLTTYINLPEYIFKRCGSPGYIAPEVFAYDKTIPETFYNDRCDVFSVACILFYMLFGFPLFGDGATTEILTTNKSFKDMNTCDALIKEINNPKSKISVVGLDLLQDLLEVDQRKRASAGEALSHPYLAELAHEASKPCSLQGINCYSNTFLSSLKGETASTQSSQSSLSKRRFINKASIYLDVGKPEINGRTDALSNNSLNANSIFSYGNIDSNSGSLSSFSARSLKREKSQAGSLNDNLSVLKAAIYRNIQKKNDKDLEEEVNSLRNKYDRRLSERLPHNFNALKASIYRNIQKRNDISSQERQEEAKHLKSKYDRRYSERLPGGIIPFEKVEDTSSEESSSFSDDDIEEESDEDRSTKEFEEVSNGNVIKNQSEVSKGFGRFSQFIQKQKLDF